MSEFKKRLEEGISPGLGKAVQEYDSRKKEPNLDPGPVTIEEIPVIAQDNKVEYISCLI